MYIPNVTKARPFFPFFKKRVIHNWNSRQWELLINDQFPDSIWKNFQLFKDLDKAKLLAANQNERKKILTPILEYPELTQPIHQSIEEFLKVYEMRSSNFDCLGSNTKLFFGSDFVASCPRKETQFELIEGNYDFDKFHKHINRLISDITLRFDTIDVEFSAFFKEDKEFQESFFGFMNTILSKAKTTQFGSFGYNMSGYVFKDSSVKKTIFLQTLAIFTALMFPNMLSIYVDFSKVNLDVVKIIKAAAIQQELEVSGSMMDPALGSLNAQRYSVAFFGDNACSTSREQWEELYSLITHTHTFISIADPSKNLFAGTCYRGEFIEPSKKLPLNLSKINHVALSSASHNF